MPDLLVRCLGWRALLIQGDPVVLDRWKWLRSRFPGSAGRTSSDRPLRMLDAGCGNGAFAFWAAARENDVLGLSDTAEDLQKARTRASLLSLQQVRFEEYDLRRLSQDGERIGESTPFSASRSSSTFSTMSACCAGWRRDSIPVGCSS